MYVLDAMQLHTDERHLHYNAVGLACVLIPKLRKSIETNHSSINSKRNKGDSVNNKMKSSTSLPSLTRGKTGKNLMSNLNKGSGMGMRALKKMTQKNAKFKELPIDTSSDRAHTPTPTSRARAAQPLGRFSLPGKVQRWRNLQLHATAQTSASCRDC